MKPKHTPGPWDVREFEHINICGKLPGQGAQSVGRLQVATVTRLRGEEVANARLIAAAPELLEALKLTLKTAEFLGASERHPAVIAAKAAIAKSEGK